MPSHRISEDLQRYYITNKATLQSRKGKNAGEVDWDTLAERRDATIGGERDTGQAARSEFESSSVNTKFAGTAAARWMVQDVRNIHYSISAHPNEGHARIPI